MKDVNKYNALKFVVSFILMAAGILFCVFSYHDYMDIFLGYLFASTLLLVSIILIIYTFIKDSEHFFRVLIYLLIVALSIIVFIDPTIFVISIPIVIGVFLSGTGLFFIIKFIILKRVSLRSIFNIVQLIGCLILLVVGILFCVFYRQIDVYITSFIIGIPLFVLGLIVFLFSLFGLIKHSKNEVSLYVEDYEGNTNNISNNKKLVNKKKLDKHHKEHTKATTKRNKKNGSK